jgi:hypothetical protein
MTLEASDEWPGLLDPPDDICPYALGIVAYGHPAKVVRPRTPGEPYL